MGAPKEMEAPVRAGYMEELRVGKRQQWAVAAAAIALIAGASHLAKSMAGVHPHQL